MAAIKCPHCGKYISSNLSVCTECGKPLSEQDILYSQEVLPGMSSPKWYRITARRVIVLCFIAPFLVAAVWLSVNDMQRKKELEQRAYERLENTTDLLFFEDFIVRFPESEHLAEVKKRYQVMKKEQQLFFQQAANGSRQDLQDFVKAHPSSPFRTACERRIDSLDWNEAMELNTLEAFQNYLALHPQGIFSGDASDMRNRQIRLIVTPEESRVLCGAIDNFLSAMTAKDVARIDELTRGPINFCGMEEAVGQNVVEYYQQNIHKNDVLGVHFQLEGTSINKRNLPGSDALGYNLYSNAAATINRSSIDSASVVNYRVTATFSPERRITSVTMAPVVDVK